MDISEIPTGAQCRVFTGQYACNGCGAYALNVEYDAIATGEYSNVKGRVRRKFMFVTYPVCRCSDHIWLSGDDMPYVVQMDTKSISVPTHPPAVGHLPIRLY